MDQCDREVPDQQAVSVWREETCHLCQNCDARCPFLSSDAHGVRLALALDLGYPLGGGQAGLPDSQRDCEVKRTCVGSGDAKTCQLGTLVGLCSVLEVAKTVGPCEQLPTAGLSAGTRGPVEE